VTTCEKRKKTIGDMREPLFGEGKIPTANTLALLGVFPLGPLKKGGDGQTIDILVRGALASLG